MSRAGLVLVDFLIGIWGVEPSSLLLLSLRVGVETGVWMNTIFVEGKRRDCSRNLNLSSGFRAFQQNWETVGISGTVTLKNIWRTNPVTSGW